MKLRILTFALLLTAIACPAQNGPTQPSVTLNWTQSTTTGVTKNCVYRGTATGVYAKPALFCSTAPITSYQDQQVTRGTTFFYAVTASVGGTESNFSNEVTATPPVVNAPTGLGTVLITFFSPHHFDPKPVETASKDGAVTAIAR